jgi:hypothetical protein
VVGKKYGPSTARAVLTFKRARNIINRSYQTQADDIVGKMTIAELDKELVKLENPPTGRVRCVIGRHGAYLSTGQDSCPKPSLQLGFLIAAATAASAGLKTAVPSVGDQVIMRLAFWQSRDKLRKAMKQMDKLIIDAPNKYRVMDLNTANQTTFQEVLKWLHVDPNDLSAAVPWIQRARNLMGNNVGVRTSGKANPPRGHPPLRRVTGLAVFARALPNDPDQGVDFGDFFLSLLARARTVPTW